MGGRLPSVEVLRWLVLAEKQESRRCSHRTRSGARCRAWAVHGTDPPACSAHAGRNVGAGAPRGNQNARTHGFYGRVLDAEEVADLEVYAEDLSIEDEIACARVALRRTIRALNDLDNGGKHPEHTARLLGLGG